MFDLNPFETFPSEKLIRFVTQRCCGYQGPNVSVFENIVEVRGETEGETELVVLYSRRDHSTTHIDPRLFTTCPSLTRVQEIGD